MSRKIKFTFIFSVSLLLFPNSKAQENISNFATIDGTIDYDLNLTKKIEEDPLNKQSEET